MALADIAARVYNLPFYRAMVFTLAYTFTVTPLAMILGFLLALGVNAVPRVIKSPVIFFSLLPMVITPLIGSLVIYWMINAEGILGAFLQSVSGNPAAQPEVLPGADLGDAHRLRHLDQRAILVDRVLCRPPDRALGHAGIRHDRRRQPRCSASALSSCRR